jgi:hypothetical protein
MSGPRFHQWRLAVCAILAVGYLSLMGEAIHCQYVMANHADAHHHPDPTSHTHPHCLTAGHCAVAAIHAAELAPIHPLQLVGFLPPGDRQLQAHNFTSSGTARAPPV